MLRATIDQFQNQKQHHQFKGLDSSNSRNGWKSILNTEYQIKKSPLKFIKNREDNSQINPQINRDSQSIMKMKNLRETMDARNKIASKIEKYSQDKHFQKSIRKGEITLTPKRNSLQVPSQNDESLNLLFKSNLKKRNSYIVPKDVIPTLTHSRSRHQFQQFSKASTGLQFRQKHQFFDNKQNIKTIQLSKKSMHRQTNFFEKKQDKQCQISFKDISISRQISQQEKIEMKKQMSLSDFSLGNCKGEGRFGKVYPAIHKKTGLIVAIKQIRKQKLSLFVDQLVNELKFQIFLNNPNIAKIYGWFSDIEKIYILLEYMEEGSLYTLIKKQEKLSEDLSAEYLLQICKGLENMHQHSIVHRDIKPENIVLTNGVCKVCDFGWAASCDSRRKTYCGTLDYVCPEILSGQEYDTSIDVWCVGVLAFEMMTGKAPFYHLSQNITKQKITECEFKFPANISPEAQHFITLSLKKDPNERYSIKELLKQDFLKKAERRLA